MANLGIDQKLQIIIVPSGATYSTPDTKTGLLIFREGTNIIEVNGHEYQAAKTGDLSKITEALKNTGYLTESDGVLIANNPGTVAALLGTKISTNASGTTKTVSAWITDLQNQITNIGKRVSTNETNITNLKAATATDGSGKFVVRESGTGKTDFATTTAIQEAINTAQTNAINAAATDAGNKDAQVKKDLIGNGVDSTADDSTALNPGSGNTWAKSETKTLSSLKDLILNLQGKLDTLTTTDLTAVNNAITAIKNELSTGNGADLANTLIDKLSTFLGGKTSWTINGTNATNVAAIITALETEIKARIASVNKASTETLIDVTTDSNKAVTVSSTSELTTAVGKANSAIQSVNKPTNESLISVSTNTNTKAVTVSSTDSLKTAVTNANSAIQSVDEVSGEALIAVNTTDKNVTVSSTKALQTAVANANAALPKGSGNTYTSAVDLANKLKGNSSSDTKASTTIEGAKKYADSVSSTAQNNAINKAKEYANSVITWTVIS